jgi:PrcB C-terminal
MLDLKMSLAVFLLSLATGGAGIAGCGTGGQHQPSAQTNRGTNQSNATPKPSPKEGGETSGDIKVLREGSYNLVAEPFVAVARDAETYQELRRLDDNLPILKEDEFKRIAVVAAFLGERRTGGYGIEMTRAPEGDVRIREKTPPRDAMLTQALTRPYKIVSVPIQDEARLKVEVGEAWRAAMRPYNVASGEFTMTGGFAGRKETMRLEGTLTVMRHERLATIFFNLQGTGGSKARELKETATGIVQASGALRLARFNAGSLVEPPANLLAAKGELTNNESNLTLSFDSLPSNINDGYQGTGRLSATATGPPPPKRPATREGAM